jgi:Beta-galactosidase
MHIHRALHPNAEDDERAWPKVRFGAWRLWDAGVAWLDLEPKKDEWHFEKLDRYVALAERHGVKVLLTLGQTPQWASARSNEAGPYGKGCAAEPGNITDWENYVRVLVTRYKGRIEAYELWNEPDFSQIPPRGFYSGTPEKMVELARVAYRVIKRIDPRAIVASPAVVAEIERLEPYFRAGGHHYADVLAAHFYVLPPERLLPSIQKFKSLMAKYGLQAKELWNTESGFLIDNPEQIVKPSMTSGVFSKVLSRKEAAANIAQFLILSKANGISRTYWYAWDNFDMGLAKDDSGMPNAAGLAYDRIVSWIDNAKSLQCNLSAASIQVCNLDRGDMVSRILWSIKGTVAWNLSSNSQARVYETLEGQKVRIETTQLQIGNAPVHLLQR